MKLEDTKELVLNYLRNNSKKGNEITGRKLSFILNIKHSSIRLAVHKLRVEGYPICSNKSGYFYSLNLNDVKELIEKIENRAYKMLETSYGLKAYLEKECY
ncbi:MAG: hypothetical protein ACRDBY_14260 [Cetobacterium sp.]